MKDKVLQAAVERQRYLSTPEVSHEQVYPGDDYQRAEMADLSVITEAYLTEHQTDDGETADRDWMVRRGWVWADFLNFEYDVCRFGQEYTTIHLDLLGGYFQVLSDIGDSPQLFCNCRTRGDIRRIEEMFHLPAKEGQ